MHFSHHPHKVSEKDSALLSSAEPEAYLIHIIPDGQCTISMYLFVLNCSSQGVQIDSFCILLLPISSLKMPTSEVDQ